MKFEKFIYKADFEIRNQQIVMTETGMQKVQKLKKITGSRLGSVLGINEYQTPFQTWCDIFGFYKTEPEEFFTSAGQIIEPKLRHYVEAQLGYKFQSYNGFTVGFDVFKENKIFGGMPDGEPVNDQNKFLYQHGLPMLEIKTASLDEFEWTKRNNELTLVKDPTSKLPILKRKNTKIKKWIQDKQVIIPLSYQYQLGLYMYLRKIQSGLFCIGLLQYDNYLHPEQYDPNNAANNLVIMEEFELDLEKFQSVIDYATKWYCEFVQKGISPVMSSTDLEWFRFGYKEI